MDTFNIFVYMLLLIDLRERKGEGEEQNITLLVHSFAHSLVVSCMCRTGDQPEILVYAADTNQLSCLARAGRFKNFCIKVTSYLFLKIILKKYLLGTLSEICPNA